MADLEKPAQTSAYTYNLIRNLVLIHALRSTSHNLDTMAKKKRANTAGDGGGHVKVPRKRAKREYDPDLPSRTLTEPHKDWVRDYQDEYRDHLGPRGRRNSAFRWVRETVAPPFLDEFFPSITPDQRERFHPWISTVS